MAYALIALIATSVSFLLAAGLCEQGFAMDGIAKFARETCIKSPPLV